MKDKRYLTKLQKYIKENGNIPTEDPIVLAIDREDGTAMLWEGNHRLTCVSNLKEGDYPEFIRVKFFFANLEDEVNFQGKIPRLKETPQSWPTWLCGCYLGFHTNYNSKGTLLYNENS